MAHILIETSVDDRIRYRRSYQIYICIVSMLYNSNRRRQSSSTTKRVKCHFKGCTWSTFLTHQMPISKVDPDISIRGGPFFFLFFQRKKQDFKAIYCKKNQKKLMHNSKQKLQNMVKRKMTLRKHIFPRLQLKKRGPCAPPPPWICLCIFPIPVI